MSKRYSAGMGRGLQMRRHGRKGAGLSWPLSLQRCDPGKRYCSLPGWQGDFSLLEQQDQADDTKNGPRCELSAADPPACAAKRFPTCSQLRVFAPHNSKRLIGLLQYVLGVNPNQVLAWLRKRPEFKCQCCGSTMKIVKTRIPPPFSFELPMPIG